MAGQLPLTKSITWRTATLRPTSPTPSPQTNPLGAAAGGVTNRYTGMTGFTNCYTSMTGWKRVSGTGHKAL